jgi:hypothetical protein
MITVKHTPRIADLFGDRLSEFESQVRIRYGLNLSSWNNLADQIMDIASEILPDLVKMGIVGKRTLRDVQEECVMLLQLEKVGLLGHPKSGKAYSLAWEYGHSSGYDEVYIYLQDLAELVKD